MCMSLAAISDNSNRLAVQKSKVTVTFIKNLCVCHCFHPPKNNKLLFRGYLESQARRRKLHKIGDIAGIIGAIIICICLCIMDVTLIINEINSTSGLVISSAIIIMFLVIDIVNKVQSKF